MKKTNKKKELMDKYKLWAKSHTPTWETDNLMGDIIGWDTFKGLYKPTERLFPHDCQPTGKDPCDKFHKQGIYHEPCFRPQQTSREYCSCGNKVEVKGDTYCKECWESQQDSSCKIFTFPCEHGLMEKHDKCVGKEVEQDGSWVKKLKKILLTSQIDPTSVTYWDGVVPEISELIQELLSQQKARLRERIEDLSRKGKTSLISVWDVLEELE